MHEGDFERVIERIEKARQRFHCVICGSKITKAQYTEIVEEVHLLLAEVNLHAVINQIPVAVPEGFVFAEPDIRSSV